MTPPYKKIYEKYKAIEKKYVAGLDEGSKRSSFKL